MSILHNINYMKGFLSHPCATPNPLILIELAFEAAGPEIFELLSADWLDKSLKSAKQGYRDPDRGKDRRPGRLIGNIPPPGPHGRRYNGNVGRRRKGIPLSPTTWMFEVVDAEQTGMYWWMVADLYTEFLARWMTLIYMKQRCPLPHDCYAEGQWTSIFIDKGENTPILPILGTGVLISGGLEIQQIRRGTYSISFQAKIEVFHSSAPPTGAYVRLVDHTQNKVIAGKPGGGIDETGAFMSGGFVNIENNSDQYRSYFLQLVNTSDTETVGVTEGHLQLSSGYCDNHAPAMPWDGQHLFPDPRR